ncbi:hypothetical protein DYB32_009849, partial [Aphanomyces invadans]
DGEPTKAQSEEAAQTPQSYTFPLSNRAKARQYDREEREKKENRKRKARELIETEDFLPLSWSSEDEVEGPYFVRERGRAVMHSRTPEIATAARRVYGWEHTIKRRYPPETMPAGCLRCGQVDHSFDKCPGSTSEERAKIFHEWKPILTRHKQCLKTSKHAKKCQATAQWVKEEEAKRQANLKRIENEPPTKMRRLLGSTGEETMATINDVLDVPYCPDSGSDVGIIPMTMVEALKALDDTVRLELLPKPWIGQVVGQTSITSTETVDLSVKLHTAAGQVKLPGKHRFYVVDTNDELIVSKYSLQSIGLDMTKLLEQVAVRQGEGDGDDIGDPNEGEDVAFKICVRNLHDMNKQLDAEDMSAAEQLFEMAMKTNSTLVADDAVQRDQLKMVVIDAAASGVWRSKFRGTDPPADRSANSSNKTTSFM